MFHTCRRLAGQADEQAPTLTPHLERYRRWRPECDPGWLPLDRAARGARDTDLLAEVRRCHGQARTRRAWLRTQQLTQSTV